ncbi:DegT/DnrJ/EryC1/StrS family aminotransferase [Desulfomicrobium escambiense]|uniref:DegT/DnrJ/EryC1/StrS family aminotransferase n=1 Tax=Desulfomicrobium escambiense TaxID=29503 RepID=UPI0003F524AA|nr:DegT/DnrJ/EryC1/StrS family aminotransferase [Desulfomicrobium escambiense]
MSDAKFISEEKIYLTKPFLPPLSEFNQYLNEVWRSRCLTNQGKYHNEFEEALAKFLKVPYVCLFTNGTLALITALQVLRITGEVITTPYSFVATTHSLWWNNIKPVFVDIDPVYCNLNPDKVESAITPQTTAILPVHVYGNPCQVDKLQEIADTYGLRLIYDAAHAFGVTINGHSLLSYGDLSILSFHATKVFNTFEGGAIICHDARTKKRIDYLKNFGFAGETSVVAPGINAKMNEFQAALGLLQLKYFENNKNLRLIIAESYRENLKAIPGISFLEPAKNVTWNNAYFPIFVDAEQFGHTRDELYNHLKMYNYICRRYFYPLISNFNCYKDLQSTQNLQIANIKSSQVICLPIYPDLNLIHVNNICKIIKSYKED